MISITKADFYIQAYDSHCNLVLGEVEETIYVVEEDDDEQETVKVCFVMRRKMAILTIPLDYQKAVRNAIRSG